MGPFFSRSEDGSLRMTGIKRRAEVLLQHGRSSWGSQFPASICEGGIKAKLQFDGATRRRLGTSETIDSRAKVRVGV